MSINECLARKATIPWVAGRLPISIYVHPPPIITGFKLRESSATEQEFKMGTKLFRINIDYRICYTIFVVSWTTKSVMIRLECQR
jgi:hypothetical protein